MFAANQTAGTVTMIDTASRRVGAHHASGHVRLRTRLRADDRSEGTMMKRRTMKLALAVGLVLGVAAAAVVGFSSEPRAAVCG